MLTVCRLPQDGFSNLSSRLVSALQRRHRKYTVLKAGAGDGSINRTAIGLLQPGHSTVGSVATVPGATSVARNGFIASVMAISPDRATWSEPASQTPKASVDQPI